MSAKCSCCGCEIDQTYQMPMPDPKELAAERRRYAVMQAAVIFWTSGSLSFQSLGECVNTAVELLELIESRESKESINE